MLFLFLHVITMFAVVTLHTGPQVLTLVAARTGNAAYAAAVASTYARSGALVPPLGILGAAFGIATAVTGTLDLTAPWLITAYGLFVVMAAYGGTVSHPYIVALPSAIAADAQDGSRVLGRRLTLIVLGDALIFVLIIADMVLKPSWWR